VRAIHSHPLPFAIWPGEQAAAKLAVDMARENRTQSERGERSKSLLQTALWVLASGVCYYLATKIAWALCFPNSKVCLIFPPHAVLVSILLLVPSRHWWVYTLAAMGGHFVAAQQAQWPLLDSLHPEAFNAVQNLLVAGGLRFFIKSPLKRITLRDAIVFVLIAVVIVPVGTAFWGAAFNANHFGGKYWVEWRSLCVSNGVTAVVFVPAILLGVHQLSTRRLRVTTARLIEAVLLGAGLLIIGLFAFDNRHAGPGTSPALLYAPIPLLIWAALRFGLGGASASMLVITSLAIWGTMHGRGPFLMQTPAENALALQLFLLVTAIPLLFLAVLLEEEKRSQSALRESELEHQLQHMELARVGRVTLMGELAASLAHEINNPLGAMVTNASVGQRLIAQGKMESDEFRELLADIVADGHRAREVIEGIRNMVRRSDASRSLIPVDEIIHDLLRIVRADALARKISITAEIDSNVGRVLGDRVRLLQVLLNLTINAFEAMTVIRADARRLVLHANNGGGEISVSVRDSGPGLSGATGEQLFEPFFTTKAEGTGMGLAIARSIIEEHGGTLSGENCAEGGACFTVRLPAAPAEKSEEVLPG
jgi:signal transduction histidine kinase